MPGHVKLALTLDMPRLLAEWPQRHSDPRGQEPLEMSKEALEKGKRPEIKKLAQQIIKAQEAEIEKMKRWRTEWERA
jgi:hypothetical protein